MRHPMLSMLAFVSLLPSPLGAAKTEAASWGKPGVSIEQYRRDAVECGRAGYYLDVSNTEAADVLKRASRQLETNETDLTAAQGPRILDIVVTSAHIVEGARPAERMKQVGMLMQGTVDDCLRQRGYIRFRLTTAQRKHLAHLHLGSPARHTYLYRLATDPKVLAMQAM
jgi:hypothetical protein